MSVVRPEFGPTLPELLAPRVRALPRAGRLALAALAAGVVVVVAWLVLIGPGGSKGVLVRKPVTFNTIYTDAMTRVPPRPGEVLRLTTPSGPPESMAVRILRLPPYRGDVSATMTLLAAGMIDRMRAVYPGFVYRSDGRANVNKQPGYQILFQARIGGRTIYGRRVLLVGAPDPPPRLALDITLLAARSPSVPKADAIGANGPLKTPFRSLRFGTDRP
jgi:hypothetical protein